MKLLLDNTGLHRVRVVVATRDDQVVSLPDALALLHLAEHIMFSEAMFVSAFEEPSIKETTAEAVAHLIGHGCITLPDGKSLLSIEDFSDSEYALACHGAANAIQEDLQLLDSDTIARAGRLADFSTKPLGLKGPAMEKWISRRWPIEERRGYADTALQFKARGAYDFILATHDPVYRLVQDLGQVTRKKGRFFLAMLLDVIFRVAINEQLARLRNCTYAPAPQRANVTHETDHLFRHALERMIQATSEDQKSRISSRLVRQIISHERLPLPMFALHFLATRTTGSPLDVLNAARELRDVPEIVELRNWLGKWEALYNSADIVAREKALNQIRALQNSLQIISEPINLFSVFRPEFSTGQDGSVGVSFDPSGLAAPVAKLWAKFSRRRVFLAALRRTLTTDRQLGEHLCRIIGRPISGLQL
jgi:hypothetical protein